MGPEIIFVVPYVLGFAAVATIGGTFAIWLVWAGLRRLGPRHMREASTAFPRAVICSVLLCIALPVGCAWACQPVPQPESDRWVAAFEVPLPTPADRAEFLTILGREAAAAGLTLDAASGAQQVGTETPTVTAYVWRGEIGNIEAYVWDMYGHVWISFSRGQDGALAQRSREQVMRKVIERWPGTLAVPITATGGLPHRRDLVVTANGYEIDPAEIEKYGCRKKPGLEGAAPATC